MENININSIWEDLSNQIKNCTKCVLCKTRKNVVIGEGNRENCKLVIVGEGPGEQEDEQGRPFVGKSGELLTRFLNDAKIARDSIYITNIVKCRPPDNRDPLKNEMLACSEFLESQLLLLHPSLVITLGNPATKWLLNTSQGITSIRGNWVEWRGIHLMPTFHPSYILRQKVKSEYDRLVALVRKDFASARIKLDALK